MMGLKDWIEIILGFATLATTAYFTHQLVKNDNARERRRLDEIKEAKESAIKDKFKYELIPVVFVGGDRLKEKVKRIFKLYPNDKHLIFPAFDEARIVHEISGKVCMSSEDFKQFLWEHRNEIEPKP